MYIYTFYALIHKCIFSNVNNLAEGYYKLKGTKKKALPDITCLQNTLLLSGFRSFHQMLLRVPNFDP